MRRVSRILVADDDPTVLRSVRRALVAAGHAVEEAEDGAVALARLRAASFDVVVTDLEMPNLDGFGLLKAVRASYPGLPVIVVTARNTVAECARAMRAGAADFLTKPFHPSDLTAAVEAAVGERSVPATQTSTSRGANVLIGDSAKLREVLEVVERVAPTEATVLIRGETGTGKELVARLLHGLSPRAASPLVAVNCGALAESLVESELFGHVRGAFTGATDRRAGRFLQADRGTIFLDEIGDLPMPAQVKLLRVLQEREIVPVGSDRPTKVDVRVLAATHRDLAAMVAAGGFRADLYYRLEVVVVSLPPLRERPADIPALVARFVDKHGARYGRTIRLTSGALAALAARGWPGNVRELENVIERLVLIAKREVVTEDELPPEDGVPSRGASPAPIASPAPPRPDAGAVAAAQPASLPEAMADYERRLIEEALLKTGGNKQQAAALLGINRTTLVEKLKRLRRD